MNINKILDSIKKNYILLNVIFLLLSIYVILFPIISNSIQQVFPQFGICPYLRITGHPCPLCGGTRYIQNLPHAIKNINYLLHPFGVIVLLIFFEIIFRVYNIIKRDTKLVEVDIIIHLIIAILFFLYEIIFLLINK